jgi:p-aminobenzoyl-glutamate transporter AbgT
MSWGGLRFILPYFLFYSFLLVGAIFGQLCQHVLDLQKKEESAETSKFNGRIVLLIIPFFSLLYALLFTLIISPILSNSCLGGVVIALYLVFLLFFPLYGWIYGTFVARNEENKYFFALYNPAVSTLVFYIFKFFNRDMWQYVVMFCWIAFWTLIPVWRCENRQEDDKEHSNQV